MDDPLQQLAIEVAAGDPPRPDPRIGRAGWAERMLALAFDAAYLLVGVLLLAVLTLAIFTIVGGRLPSYPLGLSLTVVWCIALVAHSLCDVFNAGTPGKRAVHTRIRRADGWPARRSMLIVRWAVKYSLLIGVVVYVVLDSLRPVVLVPAAARELMLTLLRLSLGVTFWGGVLAALPARRALWDIVAGTAVYHDWATPAAETPARAFEVVRSAVHQS